MDQPFDPNLDPAWARSSHFWPIVAIYGLFLSLPILTNTMMPGLDGPSHVYLSQVLAQYGTVEHPIYQEFFEINWVFQPNMTSYLLVKWALAFLSPDQAERALWLLHQGTFLAASGYCVAGVGRNRLYGMLLLLPLSYGYLFVFGMYNYSFSLVLMLVGLGLWLRLSRSPNTAGFIALGAVAFLGYITHLFPTANLLLIIGLGTAWREGRDIWSSRGTAGKPALAREFAKRVIPYILALGPTFALMIWFSLGMGETLNVDRGYGLGLRLINLTSLSFLLSLGVIEILFAIIVMVALAVPLLGLRNIKQPSKRDGQELLFLLIVYVSIYFSVPQGLGGSSLVLDRLLPVIYICGVLWVVHQRFDHGRYRFALIVLALSAITAPPLRAYQFHLVEQELAVFNEIAQNVETGRTILSVPAPAAEQHGVIWSYGWRMRQHFHATSRVAAQKGLIDLKSVQANSRLAPVRYRDKVNPFWLLPAGAPAYPWNTDSRAYQFGRLEADYPNLDFDGYRERSGHHVDYLVIWGQLDRPKDSPEAEAFWRNVNNHFRPVPLRGGAGKVQLYQRNGL